MTISPLEEIIKVAETARPLMGRRFAKGNMAHLAIQHCYRVEHPGNFIITERAIGSGVLALGTIGQFAKMSKRGRVIVKFLKNSSTSQVKRLRNLLGDDFRTLLVYLLDVSTTVSGKYPRKSKKTGKMLQRSMSVIKRFDIVDFGPLIANASVTPAAIQAFEIKPRNEFSAGQRYVLAQGAAFNILAGSLASTLGTMFNVQGLEKLRMVSGEMWPQHPRILPLGDNILLFYWGGPGVILYDWLQYKTRGIRPIYVEMRSVRRYVDEAMARSLSLSGSIKPEVYLVMAVLATLALLGVAVALVQLGAAATALTMKAGAVSTSVPALMLRLANGISALTISLLPQKTFAADQMTVLNDIKRIEGESEKSVKSIEDYIAENGGSESLIARSLAAVSAALGAVPTNRIHSFSRQTDVGQSGGVNPEKEELDSQKLATLIARELVYLLAVSRGQGNDDTFSDTGVHIVTGLLSESLALMILEMELGNFLLMCGESEVDEASAMRIAQKISAAGNWGCPNEVLDQLIRAFCSKSDEEFDENLPEGLFFDIEEIPAISEQLWEYIEGEPDTDEAWK